MNYHDTKESTLKDIADALDDARTAPSEVTREATRPRLRRGFAVMDPARQREIASRGGKASHERGTGHQWTSEEAREAGRKGGRASHGGRGRAPRGDEGPPERG